ncbi:hypothetical protein [Allomesorhizobium alhagi]|jgi:hypothetical protein|uniref:Uncharacterized protein n=1 Tax=Mesorhizobium alhagi CCNWXJ12-2 TaxID=1107882 RepID=H0HPV1_9HYPH|nr:hypothetical protein [Mesorhizobium alhagi]EHK57218.1 hypothetical protein MAXJ12_10907 [Mesorhizobium alhagi CCNWXJ12-2]
MPTNYDKRQDSEGLWEVYDNESDETVAVDIPLAGLGEAEADEAIDKLKRGELTSDNVPETSPSGRPSTTDGSGQI